MLETSRAIVCRKPGLASHPSVSPHHRVDSHRHHARRRELRLPLVAVSSTAPYVRSVGCYTLRVRGGPCASSVGSLSTRSTSPVLISDHHARSAGPLRARLRPPWRASSASCATTGCRASSASAAPSTATRRCCRPHCSHRARLWLLSAPELAAGRTMTTTELASTTASRRPASV